MIKWFLRRAIDHFERAWGYDACYMRDMIETSPQAAWLFSRVAALGRFRRDVPIAAWCAAGITAVRHEDCGPCTQLAVTMAERSGVSAAVLRPLLTDDRRLCRRMFVWCGTSRAPRLSTMRPPNQYREAIVKKWGQRAVISLAFAITAARIYPTVKYALGYGRACLCVNVGGAPLMFDHGRVPAQTSMPLRSS